MTITDGFTRTQTEVKEFVGDGSTLVYHLLEPAASITTVENWETGAWAEKTETTHWSSSNTTDSAIITFVDNNEPGASVAAVYTLTFAAKASTVAGDFVTITTPDNSTYAVWFKTVAAAVAQVETVTSETKADSDDGDFIVVTSQAGDEYAVALDVTGASAEPTAAEWLAVPEANRVQADISGDTTAADVAARVETAFGTLSAPITTDDTAANGTMSFTQDVEGACAAAVSYQDDGEASDITWAVDVTGLDITVEPTSSAYTAVAGQKAVADVSAATDAASVAAIAEISFDGITGFTAKCVTDDTAANGTMTFTMQTAGDCADPEDYASASETDGTSSVTWAETTEGKTTTLKVTYTTSGSSLKNQMKNTMTNGL